MFSAEDELAEDELYEACRTGNLAMVRNLLAKNPYMLNASLGPMTLTWYHGSSTQTSQHLKPTPLMVAVQNNHQELVAFFLAQKGTNLSVTINNQTALSAALFTCEKAHDHLARMLMKSGADVNQVLVNKTVLSLAWYDQNQDVALKLVLSFSASIQKAEELFNTHWKNKYPYSHIPAQIELTKKLLVEEIINIKQTGVDIERLSLGQIPHLKVTEYLYDTDSLAMRAFKAGQNFLRKRLASRMPAPRLLTFMHNSENERHSQQSEKANNLAKRPTWKGMGLGQ
jgi:hypothetical protein